MLMWNARQTDSVTPGFLEYMIMLYTQSMAGRQYIVLQTSLKNVPNIPIKWNVSQWMLILSLFPQTSSLLAIDFCSNTVNTDINSCTVFVPKILSLHIPYFSIQTVVYLQVTFSLYEFLFQIILLMFGLKFGHPSHKRQKIRILAKTAQHVWPC